MINIEKQGKIWWISGTFLQETRTGRPAAIPLEPMPYKQRYIAVARKEGWERRNAEVVELCAAILAARRAAVAEILAVRANRATQLKLF